jgi:hypothetical protein
MKTITSVLSVDGPPNMRCPQIARVCQDHSAACCEWPERRAARVDLTAKMASSTEAIFAARLNMTVSRELPRAPVTSAMPARSVVSKQRSDEKDKEHLKKKASMPPTPCWVGMSAGRRRSCSQPRRKRAWFSATSRGDSACVPTGRWGSAVTVPDIRKKKRGQTTGCHDLAVDKAAQQDSIFQLAKHRVDDVVGSHASTAIRILGKHVNTKESMCITIAIAMQAAIRANRSVMPSSDSTRVLTVVRRCSSLASSEESRSVSKRAACDQSKWRSSVRTGMC